jgi:hypothetical protein
MPKKQIKTTVIKEEEELTTEENPISKLIKKFFDTGDFDPALNDLQFEIRVMRWDGKLGKYVTMYGTRYDDLQGMIETLGQRYGSQRYKFYVKARNAEGKMVAGAVIEHDLFWDSEEEPEEIIENEPEETKENDVQNVLIAMLQNQITQQSNLIIELIKNLHPGTNNIKSGEIFEAIQLGVELAQGKNNPDEEDSSSDTIIKFLNTPIGGLLAKKLLDSKPQEKKQEHNIPIEETSLPPAIPPQN